MRFILLAICFLFVACSTTDLSGTYICNDVIFSSQTMTPTEIAENQKAAKEDLVGSSVTVVQYDETIWIGFSDTDGDHFRKASNNEYVFMPDEGNGDKVVAKFVKDGLVLKEFDNRYTIEIVCNKQ